MPAHDIFHDHVKNALVKDGWIITNDPLKIVWGKKKLFVDLGAEKVAENLLAAEKAERRIAVEIKSFVGKSDMADLEDALGQFVLYQILLEQTDPERTLYLAVHNIAFEAVFEKSVGRVLIDRKSVRVIVFDARKEEIVQWVD